MSVPFKTISNKTKKINCRNLERVLKNSQGSTMVESSIYFPIILLATMFTIYMMINMYCETVYQAKINKTVRAESMKKSENAEVVVNESAPGDKFYMEAENRTVNLSEGKEGLTSYVFGSGQLEMNSGQLIGYKRNSLQYSAKSYCIDEKIYIWG